MMKTLKNQSREKLRAEYRTYLCRQRGLTESTIKKCCSFAVRFLDFKFGDDPDDLSKITGYDITNFLLHLTGRVQPLRDKSVAYFLRSFFRFLFQTEKIETNLALGIPSATVKCARRIPYHLTLDQVEELLEASRTISTSKSKKRDYAMVLLMARLGLRSQEVIAIQLDDIDWRKGEVCIRGKGGYHDKIPLIQDVGDAIADYIMNERKSTYRHLFVGLRSPHRPFKGGQILNTILKQALDKTSIPRPKLYTVSHILRHSLATNLVQQGASLEEIGNTLRHRSRQTTLLYARQDISGLRTIAQSWPLVKGGQS
ncbi:MAG: tyrosine-type recombinase/integrase [Cyclobacteriaceae bacterium]|nr:tyrosine-type recombinase/integrase [Cyclobacteriaceae bacterium]